MTGWKSGYWQAFGGSAVATALPLLATDSAYAHKGSHAEEPESASPSEADAASSSPETTTDASPEPSDGEMVMPASEEPLKTDETPIQAESPTKAVSQANVAEGFPIGWGESLLGLIVAGPFLLLSLRKQLQS